ncbi:MAG: transposase [Ignavibacterium sp.]|jgi:REP element-mobilizing transposase RayT|nr:transposase [Ignavibacterium sp.]
MNELPKRKNTRLKEFDYSQSRYYFVTICLKDRKEFFSHIINTDLILTEYGKILDEVWRSLPKYYNVELDYYVFMPDHFHGILILDNTLTVKNDKEDKQFSLSEIIGKYKSYSARKIREILQMGDKFEWQKSFYDRIIRNESELYNIRKYIKENPLRWDIERNNPENLEM